MAKSFPVGSAILRWQLTTICLLALSAPAGLSAADVPPSSAGESRTITLELRRRDPLSGEARTEREGVDPSKVGGVVVDMWNWHWCKTSTMRVGALVPRMNRALAAARALGMQVFLCPTDVADNYVGTTMVESLIATPLLPVPQARRVECPAAPDGGGCTCGKERCQG